MRFESDQNGGNIFELIENGSQIKVNNENKIKYIELMAKYHHKITVENQNFLT